MRRIMDFSNVVMTMVTGLYLVLLTVAGTENVKAIPDWLVDSTGWRLFFLALGVFLVAVNIRTLVKDWREGGLLRENLRIPTEQGMTELSVPSLEMLILRDLRAEPDIVEPFVKLRPKGVGKPMRCFVELKLRRQPDVIKRGDAIKRKVRDIIDQLIPGGLTVEVLVDVRDIVSESVRAKAPAAKAAASEFNGPVYSNDSGSDGV